MPDYLPGGDAEFNAWLNNFAGYAGLNLASLGLVAGDLTPVTTAQSAWNSAFLLNNTAQQAAQATRQTKETARHNVEALLRPLVRRLQASPAVDNAERASLGITVPDAISTPVGPPTTRPVVSVDHAQRLQHTINFNDEATPTKKAKPAGAMGAEVWVMALAVGQPAPTNPDDLTFVALDTRTPYVLDFDAADGGKNAHYMLRWVNTRGEKGPWSATTSATVGV